MPPRTPPPRGSGPTRWEIDRIDSTERRYGYTIALGAALVSGLVGGTGILNPPKHRVPNTLSPLTYMLVGLGFAIVLAVATRIGRRALLAFVALMAGLFFITPGLILGLIFLGYGGWLLYRSFKIQRQAAKGELPAPAAGEGGRETATTRPAASDRPGRRKSAPAGPTPSKRYTPKKPKPPPIPVSRREQRRKEREQSRAESDGEA